MGFDWDDATGALEKVQEEVGEVREALTHGKFPRLEEEHLRRHTRGPRRHLG